MRFLILQCRNLGDAVISTIVVNSLGRSFPGCEIDILSRPEFMPIFESNPYIGTVHFAQFPMGTQKEFGVGPFLSLVGKIRALRRREYDCVLNLVGDIRENALGWMIGGRENFAPRWMDGHPFSKIGRLGGYRLVSKTAFINSDTLNVYGAYRKMALWLGCKFVEKSAIFLTEYERSRSIDWGERPIIALHPFAGQSCKEWASINWRTLAKRLLSEEYRVWIFGSKSDFRRSREYFEGIEGKLEFFSGGLREFFASLSHAKVLVGLDSFSAHAACALGVPGIMLNGANDYRIWAPPTTSVVFADHGCPDYPCYNKPRCLARSTPYICMDSITVEKVIDRIENVLFNKDGAEWRADLI